MAWASCCLESPALPTGGLQGFACFRRRERSIYLRLVRHGLMDMVLIFTAEYLTGVFLNAFGVCPWDYSMWPDHIGGVIRLAFAPLWFCTGLLFERILAPS